jgi:indolepyruvate ferredoxin oxidoreductase, alpha subunit
LSGAVPEAGELTPDTVRGALVLPSRQHVHSRVQLPVRPPQLCQGCPHAESFSALRDAIGDLSTGLRPSDIGCYALGALPPHAIVDSVVCMGASIGMAKGAAESGVSGVVAAIGDSTFLHSGIPALIDAVEANTPMTVLILDNGTVAMTGGQPTAVPPGRIEAIVQGIGVEPDHIVTLSPSKANREENAQVLRQEIAYPGPSVVVSRRGCVRFAARMHKGGE